MLGVAGELIEYLKKRDVLGYMEKDGKVTAFPFNAVSLLHPSVSHVSVRSPATHGSGVVSQSSITSMRQSRQSNSNLKRRWALTMTSGRASLTGEVSRGQARRQRRRQCLAVMTTSPLTGV